MMRRNAELYCFIINSLFIIMKQGRLIMSIGLPLVKNAFNKFKAMLAERALNNAIQKIVDEADEIYKLAKRKPQ